MKEFNTILALCEKLSTESKCVEYFIKLRWKHGVECPHCKSKKVYTLKNGKSFRCGNTECRETFSIRTGTVMEASNISIKKWILAIYLATSNKKGISSVQLGKHIGISQQSAWFMLHRIREAKGIKFNCSGEFDGTTEIDECYVGGSESNKHTKNKFKSEKSVIVGLVNRDTKQAKAYKIDNADKECLLPKIGVNVKENSTIVTDTYHAYKDLKNIFTHKTVKHSANEYVRNELDIDGRVAFKVHTNTVEGFWSLVKRTINGTHHWISKKHTNRYLAEMTMRYNTREESEGLRLNDVMSNLHGRLKYKRLVGRV